MDTYLLNGGKDGDTEVGGAGLGGGNPRHHVGAVGNGLFSVEGTLHTETHIHTMSNTY